jgi:hypothetical protein
LPEAQSSRIAFLRERVETADRSAARTTFDVPYRQRQLSLVKIEVPIGFPLYNLRSGRTHRGQAEWIERFNLPNDFFVDPEDQAAQDAQHQILVSLLEKNPVLSRDLADKDQRSPVILTYDGFIIDGNRRVAALREQGDVEQVIAVVVPEDATSSDVYETELELQMAIDTKEDYDWIDEAIHVAYGIRELNEPLDAVARRMNMVAADVERILHRLHLVDLYLEWVGAPGRYHRVPEDALQSFIELADRDGRQQVRNLPEPQRRTIRYGSFTVIQAGDDGGYMRVRQVADALRTDPAEVVERTRERLPEPLREQLEEPVELDETADGAEPDLLTQLAGAEAQANVPTGAELLNVLSDPHDARQVAPILMDIAEEIDQEQRDVKSQLEPLKKIERAVKILQAVRLTQETQRLSDIGVRLDELGREAERVAAELSDLRDAE